MFRIEELKEKLLPELKDIAKELGIKKYHFMKKGELIELITMFNEADARQSQVDVPVENKAEAPKFENLPTDEDGGEKKKRSRIKTASTPGSSTPQRVGTSNVEKVRLEKDPSAFQFPDDDPEPIIDPEPEEDEINMALSDEDDDDNDDDENDDDNEIPNEENQRPQQPERRILVKKERPAQAQAEQPFNPDQPRERKELRPRGDIQQRQPNEQQQRPAQQPLPKYPQNPHQNINPNQNQPRQFQQPQEPLFNFEGMV